MITNKLKDNRGESIIEALVSLLIAVISIALLVGSITAATKINEKIKAEVTEELSFSYVQTDGTSTGSGKNGTAKIDFGSDTGLTTSIDVNVYTTENGYSYYEKKSN